MLFGAQAMGSKVFHRLHLGKKSKESVIDMQ